MIARAGIADLRLPRLGPAALLWYRWVRVTLAIAALLLLNSSLTFANVWPTPKIQWQPALSVELAGCILLLAIVHRRSRLLLRVLLPVLWVVLVIGRYLDVTAPALYGRPFNLYWDAPHLGNVMAMFTDVAAGWLVALVLVAVVLIVAVVFVVSRAALTWLAAALEHRRMRVALCTLAVAVIIGFAVTPAPAGQPSARVFTDPVIPAYVRQVRSVVAMMGPSAVAPALAPSPAALASTPSGLGGADVLLVFVESYGAVTFDSPSLASTLAPSRRDFEAAVEETGRRVVSAFVESPTFGGSSWLAHLTLLSGVPVRDQYSYQSLMTQPRDTLVTTFSRAGYRTVALMPGMRQAWPEGAFYRYDTIYGRRDLEYEGPQFGWWSIPDQYALAKLGALEGPQDARRPLFVVFPTSTTHAPFGPVAPYQPDWTRVLRPDAYDPDEVARILARPPDWTNLSADYGRATAYEFTTFAGYLRERAGDELVMVLIGDHQPPAMVSGTGAPWTVPVHVVTHLDAVIDRLVAQGFRPGVIPTRPPLGDMHELVPMLLHAFGTPAD